MNAWRRAWWLSLVIILAGTGGVWLLANAPLAASGEGEEHHDEHGHGHDEHSQDDQHGQHDEHGPDDEHGHEEGGARTTTISAEAAAAAGVRTARAGPASLVQTVGLTGTVQADPARLAEVRPRYAGIVREVRANIGQRVRAGDVMAVVESNDSLQTFQVTAPIGGLVLSRNVQVGQVAGDAPLFQLVDISEVWIQLDVFARDLGRVRAGTWLRRRVPVPPATQRMRALPAAPLASWVASASAISAKVSPSAASRSVYSVSMPRSRR